MIVGIGNPFRSDDALGWLAIDRLIEQGINPEETVKISGQATEIMDLFERHESVIVLDAVHGERPGHGGEIISWDWYDDVPFVWENVPSTHGFGLREALELGEVMQVLPEKLKFFGIVGENFKIGETQSKKLIDAMDDLVSRVKREYENA